MATRRYSGIRAVGQTVEKLTRPIFGRRGFAGASVLTDWQNIVGEHLAQHTQPDRIAHDGPNRTEGTLHLRIDSASLATELVHIEPQLVERINTYFGYKAVARLRLMNGPIAREKPAEKREIPPLDEGEESRLKMKLAVVDDPELRAALDALGRGIMGEVKKP